MKQKLYIDFDGTLYDSDKLTLMFIDICEKYSLTKADEEQAEAEVFDERYLFDLDIVAEYMHQKHNLPIEFLNDVKELYLDSNIYKDIIVPLEKIKDKYELIILTYGDLSHQQQKIEISKLSKYFKDIIITETDKSKLTEVDYKNGIFIDNNPYQIEKLLTAGASRVIRIRRPIDKYSKIDLNKDVNEYDNFLELVEKELL